MSKEQNKKTTTGTSTASPAGNTVAPNSINTLTETVIPAKNKFSLQTKFAFILAVVSLMLYANTLKNGFVFDDFTVITENTLVQKGIPAVPEILHTPYRLGYAATVNDLYRPLSLVLFATEYQFFDKDPLPYHLFNVLLFAGCVLLLFLFFDRLFERKKTGVAFISALLFALHPIHTEVVANIKSCDELLCFLFAFISLNLFFSYAETGKIKHLLTGSFCFLLSLLAKETAITFLAIVPLVFLFYKNNDKKRSTYITVATMLVSIVYLITRFSVLAHYHANESSNISLIENALVSPNITYSSRLATAILVLGYYAKLLFVPYPLICDYSYNSIPFASFSTPGTLISLLLYSSLIFFGVQRLRKNNNDPYAFGVLFYLITMSLFSNIPFLIGTIMGERLVFFASAGFCLIVALILEKIAGATTGMELLKDKKVIGILVAITVIFSVITVNRNGDWLSNNTLFSTDIKNQPQSGRLNFNLGLELARTTSSDEGPEKVNELRREGINYLNTAVVLYPPDEPAHSALCNAYFRNGQYDSAELHGEIAYRLNPRITSTLNSLAGIYFIKKDYVKAVAFCAQAIKIEPALVQPYANMGLCYINLNKFDSAIYFFKKVIAIDPSQQVAYQRLAQCYTAIGKPDSANIYAAMIK